MKFLHPQRLIARIIYGVGMKKGSGIDCMFLDSPKLEPAAVVFGRNITMEVDLAQALGVDYRESIEADNAKAWEEVRGVVSLGRPTMLCGDVFYLDYRRFKVHFPAHRYVLVGFDEDARILATCGDPAEQDLLTGSERSGEACLRPEKTARTASIRSLVRPTDLRPE